MIFRQVRIQIRRGALSFNERLDGRVIVSDGRRNESLRLDGESCSLIARHDRFDVLSPDRFARSDRLIVAPAVLQQRVRCASRPERSPHQHERSDAATCMVGDPPGTIVRARRPIVLARGAIRYLHNAIRDPCRRIGYSLSQLSVIHVVRSSHRWCRFPDRVAASSCRVFASSHHRIASSRCVIASSFRATAYSRRAIRSEAACCGSITMLRRQARPGPLLRLALLHIDKARRMPKCSRASPTLFGIGGVLGGRI